MTRSTKMLLFVIAVLAVFAACKSPLANAMLTVDPSRCIGCGECLRTLARVDPTG